ncbi:MAG: hypothetical protein J5761_04625 [Paludibacteraceae bacterium]|nr:hypothetical protein [Paludibacteraceae bacterium]
MIRPIVLSLLSFVLCPLSLMAEAFPVFGVDSTSGTFFRDWYQTTDLGHYLDNCNAYVVYESETTGEWNLGDQNIFSIAGNSFRQNKYHLNGMRIDSRQQVGSTLLLTQMDRTSLALDYHDGELFFTDDSLQKPSIRLTGNVGNLGGISPGTRQLINLFHSSGEERTMDRRPVEMRNHVIGAGTLDATVAIPAYGRHYYQHVYVNYGQRRITAFDPTGICGMYPSEYYTAQVDGELPLNSQLSTLNYFLVTNGRSDYGSEFLYNANEVATLRDYQAGLYSTTHFANDGKLVAGVSYELGNVRHDTLGFARNLYDHDGEAFDPWYADGRLHSVNLSVQYDQPLLPWLRVHAEAYNSLLHFRPTTTAWSNDIYTQSIADAAPTPLYTIHWQSAAFTSGLLENEALVIAEKNLAKGLNFYAHAGVSLDGIVLGNGRSVVTPNWLAKVAIDYSPAWWFRFGLSVSHHRMSYTWDEVRYLSNDYMNGEIRYADNTLLATTGGAYHTPDRNLWMHQPSYAVLDLPIQFTFGRSRRHEIALLNSIRKYYNMWFTDFANGPEANMVQQDGYYYLQEGQKDYTVTTQPLDLMSSRVGGRTPYYMSNLVRYTYNGRKWFVMVSWQSYLMAGLSTLGNGQLHNNIGVLVESSANPDTYRALSGSSLPYPGNCRLNQDKSFILRMQVTYNACRYFSIGFNGKFKDGQSFSTFTATPAVVNGHPQVAIVHSDAKGINMANGNFGKREDAFFNLELRATGRWWVRDVPMSLEVMCYNLYDFGTALTEYTFDDYIHPTYPHWTVERGIATMKDSRTSMSLCIPRGLLLTLRVGLEKDKQ